MKNSNFLLDVDASGFEQIARDLAATEAQVQKALNSTLAKLAKWLRGVSASGLAKHLGIQRKVIAARLRIGSLCRSADGSEIKLWYGLNPISLIRLQAKQNQKGVKASGGRFVERAFIAIGRNKSRHVFKRRGTKRLPIDKQSADIQDPALIYMEDEVVGHPEFEERMLKVFEHELKWRMQKQK